MVTAPRERTGTRPPLVSGDFSRSQRTCSDMFPGASRPCRQLHGSVAFFFPPIPWVRERQSRPQAHDDVTQRYEMLDDGRFAHQLPSSGRRAIDGSSAVAIRV
jgi:hypothetical protein